MKLLTIGTYGLFRVNDWAFVAARTLQDAIDWHRREFRGDIVDLDECEPMRLGFAVLDERTGQLTSARKIIEQELAMGNPLPFLAGIDSHYA